MHEDNQRLLAELQEPRFAAIFRSSPLGICITTLEEGTFLDANPAFLRTENLTLESILGRTSLDLGYWHDPNERWRVVQKLKETGSIINYEMSHRLKDGTINYSLRSLERITLDGRDCILTMLTDITDRKAAEQTLAASEARFRAIVEHGGDAFFLMDANGTVTFGSPANAQNLGYTDVEFVGRNAFEFVHPNDLSALRDQMGHLLQTPNTEVRWQVRGLHRNGSWRWLDAFGCNRLADPNLHSIVVSYRDITERRRTEEENQRFGRILEESLNEIYVFDVDSLRFVRVNKGARLNLGYSMEELSRLTPLDLKPEFNRESFAALIEPLRSGQRDQIEFETVHRRKDGSTYPVEVHLQLSDGGHAEFFVAIIQDITERQRAEQAVRDNEARLMGLVNSAMDAIITVDEDQHIVLFNPAAEKMFQCSRADVLGELIQQFIPKRFLAAHAQQVRQFANSGTSIRQMGERSQVSGLRRDGSEFPAEASILKVQVGERQFLTVILRDISERQRTEQALRDSEERQRLLVQASNIGLWDWDLITNEVFFSPEWKGQLGYADAEVPNRYEEWESRLHPDDVSRTLQAVSDFRAGQRNNYDIEFRLRHKDGSWRWILTRANLLCDAAGQPIRMMGCHIDVTDRKQAEESLRESEERLGYALDATTDGVWDWNIKTGTVLFSPRWITSLGYSPEEVPASVDFWKSIVHSDDLPRVMESVASHFAKRTPVYECENRLRMKSGHYRSNLDRGKVVEWDKDGTPLRMVGTDSDITERKRAEAALAEHQRQLTAILGNLPGMVYRCSNDSNWTMTFVSDGAEQLTGFRADELLNNRVVSFGELVHPEDREWLWDRCQRSLAAREPCSNEYRIQHRDGSIHWVWDRATGRDGPDGSLLFVEGYVTDITERKQAELALATERLLLRTMADNLPANVFVKDTLGRYLFVNLTHVRQLGLNSEAAILGKTVFDIFPTHIARSFDADDQTVIQTGQPVIEREERFEVSGDIGWFLTTKVPLRDAEGAITGLVGIAWDITARKHAEAALVEERNLLRTLVDHIPDFIFVKDTQSRQLLNNAANLRLVGARSDAEMLGKTVFDLYPREQAQRYYDEDQRVMRSGHTQLNQEESVLDQDGRERWLLSSKVPLRDIHGKCIGLVGIKRDITEQRRANTELAASRTRLEILSRQLIATQEHERRHLARELHDEIGQALTGIKLNLKALQQSARTSNSPTLVADTIAVVDQTLQQVRSLALDLRPSMLDDIGLVAALRWCLDRQARLAGFVATFVTDAADGHIPPDVAIACFRIAQESLTNIARHAHAHNVQVELHHRETKLELLVHDDGCGFDVAAACNRAARGGSLGLLGMEERAQIIGGKITITSSPTDGTTMHAWFPM